jgi:3'-5' exoribonuclease
MRGCIRTTVHHEFVPSADDSEPGSLHAVPAPALAVATMRAGDEVSGVFACTRKDRLTARTGTPYLALELRDRTGAISGRLFRDADRHAGRFEQGDLVHVAGRVERFREELQLEVRAIARAQDADPAAFLPVAYRDLDELDGFLEHLAGEVRDPAFAALLGGLLADPEMRAALRRTPCTRNGHHAYLGGLLEHTVAVATLALEACVLHPRLDQDLLLTAAIVHDLGRTREFVLGAEIGISEEGRLLGHVELGLRMLDERAGPLDAARRLALDHCVLTHHGDRRAATPEALALQRLNAVDAAIKGALEHGMAGA